MDSSVFVVRGPRASRSSCIVQRSNIKQHSLSVVLVLSLSRTHNWLEVQDVLGHVVGMFAMAALLPLVLHCCMTINQSHVPVAPLLSDCPCSTL